MSQALRYVSLGFGEYILQLAALGDIIFALAFAPEIGILCRGELAPNPKN